MKRVILCAALLTVATPVAADQTSIPNYNAARGIFWSQLYVSGGFTLYCAQPFFRSLGLNVEHVYAASWMSAHLGCTSRTQCRQTSARFNHMEADLHNLFPARAGTNAARSNYTFGDVPGELREFGTTCDFEVDTDNDVAEPPPNARGDVARAIFYMHQEYGLPIEATLLPVLQVWNMADPPTTLDRWRNDAIEARQGTRNPFIDHPELGNGL